MRLERIEATGGSDAFVEINASQLRLASRTVIRLERGDGARLEIEFGQGAPVDVLALAEALWGREG
jgi:hypothetical protein